MKNKTLDCCRAHGQVAPSSGPSALRGVTMNPEGKPKAHIQHNNHRSQAKFDKTIGSGLIRNEIKSKEIVKLESPQPEMISRRDILLRAKQAESKGHRKTPDCDLDDEDVWHDKDKLCQDHIQEVFNKWEQIDDEIWAKVICMEKNRRVAKAYARLPFLIVDGSDIGFDGIRVGLKGFENIDRPEKTKEILETFGEGVKIKMDGKGNILIKRVGKAAVYVKSFVGSSDGLGSCIGKDIIESKGKLEYKKVSTLFDIRSFQAGISAELKATYPQTQKLESQCITAIAFGKESGTLDLLETPSWIMIINIVLIQPISHWFLWLTRLVDLIFNNNQLNSKDGSIIEGNTVYQLIAYDTGLIGDNKSPLTKQLSNKSDLKRLEPSTKSVKGDKFNRNPSNRSQLKSLGGKIRLPDPDYDFELPPIREKTFLRKEDPYYCGLSAKVSHGLREKRENGQTNGLNRIYKPANGHKNQNKYPLINRFYSYSSSDSSPSSCETSYSTIYNSISDGSTRLEMKTGRY
uniref:MH2 domain-containing protein n=1 Tax=Tetranychus urticae TaxID=32264 RepID=T1KQ28_TETUR